jgi:hypothetical protein
MLLRMKLCKFWEEIKLLPPENSHLKYQTPCATFLWDWNRRPEGGEWEPFKNSPREQGLCPKINPTWLSPNHEGDTSQLVTSSP